MAGRKDVIVQHGEKSKQLPPRYKCPFKTMCNTINSFFSYYISLQQDQFEEMNGEGYYGEG